MKKLMKSLMLFAAAAMALTSCQNEEMNEGIEKNDTFTVNFVTDAPESRTSVEISEGAANFVWGATGEEKFQFAQYAEGAEALTLGTNVQFTNNAGKGEISATFEGDAETVYNFTAVYPANAWVANTNTNFNGVKVIFNNSQDLIAGTFDPNADLLVSKMITGTLEDVSAVAQQLQFTRLVSIAEMNLKLLQVTEGEKITSVTFEVSDSTPALAGRAYLDLESGQIKEYGYNDNKYNSITISDLNGIAANNESVKVYFTCMPTTIAAGTEYTITVITNKAVYTKSSTLPKDKNLTFEVGKVKAFGVDMEDAAIEAGNAFTIPWEENFGADFDASKYTLKNGGSDTKVYSDGNLAGGEVGELLIGKTEGSMSATFASDGSAKTLNLWFKSNKDFIKVSSATEGVTIEQLSNTGYTVTLAEGVKMFSLTLSNNSNDNARVDDIVLTEEAPKVASLKIEGQTISFTEGDEFVFDGTVTAVYENGVTESVETGYTVDDSAVDMTKAGNYDVTISYSGVSASYTIEVASADIKTVEATLSFANMAQRTSYSASKQVWEQNNITFTNEKSASTNDVANYANPVRLYASSSVTINAPSNITKIVFTANNSSYATALKNSIGSTATVSGNTVTVITDGSSTSFTIAKLTAQVRLNSLTVTYIDGGNGGGTETKPQDQTLSFPEASYNATIGEDFVEPTLEGDMTDVTYTSSNEDVATVDAETGDITLLSAGFTTITATAAATAEYNSATASYTLTVNEPENPVTPPADGEEQTYTVDNFNNELGFGGATSNVTDSQAYALGSDLTLTGYKNGNNNAPGVNKDGSLRLYTNNYIEIASEKTITKIEFTFTSASYTGTITATPGTYSNGTWTGSANSVTFENTSGSQARIKTMTITYAN